MKERIEEIAEAFNADASEVEEKFEEMMESEQELHPTLEENKQQARAVRRTYLHFKRNAGFGGNIPVEGIILGTTDAIDLVAKRRRDAKEAYAKNPDLAVKKGITDAQGRPLDNRKSFGDGSPNPNYGEPLPESKYRYITVGLYTWGDHETPQPMTSFIDGRGDVPPLFKRVRFDATFINEDTDRDFGIINVPSDVEFEVVDEEVNVKAIVDKFMGEYSTNISSLGEYIAIHGDRNTAVVEADVTRMWLDTEEGKSRSLIIDDESTLFDDESARVWLPDHAVVDFAEDSRVIVIGSARSNDYGVSIQAQGVYALPEFKIALPDDLQEYGAGDF